MALRQDKTRRITFAPEVTPGTAVTSGHTIFPARDSTRIAPEDSDVISNSDALDGYAGEIAGTAGARGLGATITCEIRDYSDSTAFPPWLLLLMSCGWEVDHSGTTITATPSTKAVAGLANLTPGKKAPIALTVADVMLDNGVADEMTIMRGAVGTAKIVLDPNGIAMIEATMKGLVVGGKYLDAATADLSAWGTRHANEGISPIVVRGATITAAYVDDTGSTAITLEDLRGIEIDMNATLERVVDAAAGDGYGVSAVWHDEGPAVAMSFADTSAIAEDVMEGYYSRRGFLSLTVTLTLGMGRSLSVTVPRIQYDAARESQGGSRAFNITGKAVRKHRGDATSPVTVAYTYA